MPSIIYSKDLNKEICDDILRRFHKFVKEGIPQDIFKGKVAATLAFQPSTRTMGLFQSAMVKGGGGWMGMSSDGLSVSKGESLEDTVRDISGMVDVVVTRHPDDDAAERVEESSFVPTINGGSGSKEHGVGAPLMLCFLEHFAKKPLQGMKVGVYGTPEINRVTKALVPLFGYYGIDLVIDDLGHFPLPKEVEDRAKANGIKSIRYDKLDNFIGDVDVLILTRGLQKGIIPEGQFPKEKEEIILKSYKPINTEHMKKMREDAVLFMLKPLIFEVERDVDSDPRAVYSKKEPWIEVGAAAISYCLGIDV